MQSPSNSQLKAIKHGEGPMLVLAGPGSGKTFVIIQRLLYLIAQKHILPEKILVISFSKASAEELKNRFQTQIQSCVNNRSEINISNSIKEKQISFVTFHALFFRILRETYHYTSKDILQEQEKREIIKMILSDPVYEEAYLKEKAEEILNKISYYKNQEMKVLKEKETEKFQSIFKAYNNEIHRRHKLDFDDMGLLCLQLWKEKEEVLQKWRDKFQYILIDEFQDINVIQFLNIQLLAKQKKNLFVVGDDDQAIYGFRGASPKYMLDFPKYYPEAEKVLLETNYRCGETIVREAGKVIINNSMRFYKEIKAFQEGKGTVVYQEFSNRQQEYRYIGEKIKEVVQQKMIPLKEIACIYRTNQDMAGLSEYFVRHKIPFTMKEQSNSIFRNFIALDMISYLQFFGEGKQRKDFLRIMNKPVRYISRNALLGERIEWKKLKEYYGNKKYMVEVMNELEKNEKWIQSLDLYGAIHYIRKVVGYEKYLKEEVARLEMQWEEAEEILEFLQESVKGISSLEGWKEYIRDYEKKLKEAKEDTEGIKLITMHACKGLEFHTVFLPDCNEGKIPHKKAVSEEDLEEERRMFYVAMTRAKERLEILYLEDKLKKHLPATRFIQHHIKKNKKI